MATQFARRIQAACAGFILLVDPVFAQSGSANTGDTAWLLTATALVLFMTLPGLALFYAGLVRGKNALSIKTEMEQGSVDGWTDGSLTIRQHSL